MFGCEADIRDYWPRQPHWAAPSGETCDRQRSTVLVVSGELVPIWLQGIGSMAQAGLVGAQLWIAVHTQQAGAALEWGAVVEELSDLEPDEIALVIEQSPVIAEVVGRAGAQAAISASEQKRLVLAKVVAAVLRGDVDDAELDAIRLLTRTLDALDEPHLSLLARMLLPRAGRGQLAGTALEGAWTISDLSEEWPEADDLVKPLVHTLEAHGLVDDVGVGTWDAVPSYSLNSYGMRLLRFLPDVSSIELERAHLTARPGRRPGELVVKNLGPGEARELRLVSSTRPDRTPVGLSERDDINGAVLPADGELTIDHWTPDRPTDDTGYLVGISWIDAAGAQSSLLELRRPK